MTYPDESKSPFKIQLPFLLVISLFLLGCAGPGTKIPKSDYLFQNEKEYVRLEPVENGASSNEHPHLISAGKLTKLLAALKANGNLVLSGEVKVFTEAQAASLGRNLSASLAKARPDQDVTFQTSDRDGFFGNYSQPSFTTGRMFVHEGRTHLIMGVIQELPDIDDATTYDDSHYPIGTRTQRIEKGWDLLPGPGRLVEQRGDWISFKLGSDPAASTQAFTSGISEEAQSDAAGNTKPERAAQRLQVLEDLKFKGLITEQEYQDKRQQILDGL